MQCSAGKGDGILYEFTNILGVMGFERKCGYYDG